MYWSEVKIELLYSGLISKSYLFPSFPDIPWLVGQLVGLSVLISNEDGKFHFHATIGAFACLEIDSVPSIVMQDIMYGLMNKPAQASDVYLSRFYRVFRKGCTVYITDWIGGTD